MKSKTSCDYHYSCKTPLKGDGREFGGYYLCDHHYDIMKSKFENCDEWVQFKTELRIFFGYLCFLVSW